jgi:hypothetical protein
MRTAKIDDYREITSTGLLVQTKHGTGHYQEIGKPYKPSASKNGYLKFKLKGKFKLAHRVVWEAFKGPIPEGMQVHHISGDRADNRLENLRLVTASENNRDLKSSNGSSKYRGVHWCKSANKWIAQIRHNGKKKHIGQYDTEKTAAIVRDLKAIELGWPLGGLNFGGNNFA